MEARAAKSSPTAAMRPQSGRVTAAYVADGALASVQRGNGAGMGLQGGNAALRLVNVIKQSGL